MDQIIKTAWDLNEKTENRYQLVYEISELAKKLVDENQARKAREDFGFDEYGFESSSYKKENSRRIAATVLFFSVLSGVRLTIFRDERQSIRNPVSDKSIRYCPSHQA